MQVDPPSGGSGTGVRVEVNSALTQTQALAALSLVRRVADADGVHPLSEHVWLHLRHGGDDRGRHFLASDASGDLIGYAHLDLTDEVDGPSGEVVVDPEHRRQGVGAQLIGAMATITDNAPLRLWAHGEQAAAGQWARSMGFTRARVLWQMRRSLLAKLPQATWPPGIHLRAFRPGIDDATWLEVNRRAFADHPEQGNWTLADLQRRMAEPWFSADGFLVAETEDGQMAGFHWTKVHGSGESTPNSTPGQPEGGHAGQSHPGHGHSGHRLSGHGHHDSSAGDLARHSSVTGHAHDAVGEVYVVGVDPAFQGRGLGRALTLAGLHHLRGLGLLQAMLYVDATNTSAIDLYTSLGFARWDVDVLYRSQPHASRPA